MDIKVVYISNSSQIGGGERCLESLFQGLRGSGVTPIVICPEPGPFVELLKGMGVRTVIRDLSMPALWPLKGPVLDLLWFVRFLRREGASLVHANSTLSGRKATLAARIAGIPLICHLHYPLPQDYYRWVYRNLPKPKRLVYVCDALQRDLGDVLKRTYPEVAQQVVYNGIDTSIYAPKDVDNPVARIGIIANLQPVKGHEEFLRMADLLLKSGVKASFEIIGSDVQKLGRQAVLENLVRELGIGSHVKFHGFVDNVVDLLQNLDVVVCSSHEEASPRCIIEAMSCRKPIVATRVNGIPDVLEDGVNGLLVPAHSPEGLFQAVRRLLDDPALKRRLAHAGWVKVNGNYSLEAYTRQILGIYEEELAAADLPRRKAA